MNLNLPYHRCHRGPVSRPLDNRLAERLHTHLALNNESGSLGHNIVRTANSLFLFLIASGLILWWPRQWRWRVVRRSLLLLRGQGSAARDWNWHTTFGFWLLIPLLVMCATGIAMSYRWPGQWIQRAAGEEPGEIPLVPTLPPDGLIKPHADGSALSFDELMAIVDLLAPDRESTILRFDPPPSDEPDVRLPDVAATVILPDRWPRTATTTFRLDAYSGTPQRVHTFDELGQGNRINRWLRVLHTGEGLGWPGKLVATLGCLGALVLVYTGFALSCRRFLRRNR